MKKNKMMRIASLLLVAVLLSTSIISGTFAKYVTSDSVADSARVAKFGVVVTGSGSLFANTYFNKELGNTPGDADDDGVNFASFTIESNDTFNNGNKNVVAPGAENNSGMTVSVTGTPEVDVRVDVTMDINDIYLRGGMDLPDMTTGNATDVFTFEGEYHPLKFKLVQSGNTLVNWGTLADVEAALEGLSKYVDANTNLGDVAAGGIGELVLTWKWDFEDGLDADGNVVDFSDNKLQDQQDTLLGDLAAGIALTPAIELPEGHYDLQVSANISVTVTQVD